MKMYILVRDDVPLGFAMVAVAHASLAAYLRFRDIPEVEEWLSGPFFKAVCKVSAKEFENAKEVPDHVVLRESALENQEVAIALQAAARVAEDVQVLEALPRSTPGRGRADGGYRVSVGAMRSCIRLAGGVRSPAR